MTGGAGEDRRHDHRERRALGQVLGVAQQQHEERNDDDTAAHAEQRGLDTGDEPAAGQQRGLAGRQGDEPAAPTPGGPAGGEHPQPDEADECSESGLQPRLGDVRQESPAHGDPRQRPGRQDERGGPRQLSSQPVARGRDRRGQDDGDERRRVRDMLPAPQDQGEERDEHESARPRRTPRPPRRRRRRRPPPPRCRGATATGAAVRPGPTHWSLPCDRRPPVGRRGLHRRRSVTEAVRCRRRSRSPAALDAADGPHHERRHGVADRPPEFVGWGPRRDLRGRAAGACSRRSAAATRSTRGRHCPRRRGRGHVGPLSCWDPRARGVFHRPGPGKRPGLRPGGRW